jgi:GT2 family glycosyltransferase
MHIEPIRKLVPGCMLVDAPENLGFAAGNNLLAKKAVEDGCEYLWILNPDMEPEPTALAKLRNFLDEHKAYLVSAPLLLFGENKTVPQIQLFGARVNFRTQHKDHLYAGNYLNSKQLPVFLEVTSVNGGSFLIRSNFLLHNNLFEEAYFLYNDEIDLMYRINALGHKVAVVSGAHVWHHHNWHPTNKSGYYRMYYYMMRNKMLYWRKFGYHFQLVGGLFKELILFPWVLKFCLKTAGLKLLYYYYCGLFHGLAGIRGKATLQF